jgi:hypothetical protein
MAIEIENDGQGLMFWNDKRSEKAPDITGVFKIDGVQYQLAAWAKDGNKGEFFSLKVTEDDYEESEGGSPRRASQSRGNGGGSSYSRGGGSSSNSGSGYQRRGKPSRR